ncbi:hypothetical protein AAAC51_09110 [Priestia megaterium]
MLDDGINSRGSWTSCLKGGHPIFSIAARKEQDLEKNPILNAWKIVTATSGFLLALFIFKVRKGR